MTIGELKHRKQEQVDNLLTECSVFFAFNNSQFAEGMAKSPLQPGEKYVRIPGGGFIPQSKLEKFQEGLTSISEGYKEAVNANKELRREAIKFELSNYECYYTGSIDDALAALGEDFSRPEVIKVFNEEWALRFENENL